MQKEIGDMLKIMFCNVENDAKKTQRLCNINRKTIFSKIFLNLVAKELKLKIIWKGKGLKECGYLKIEK